MVLQYSTQTHFFLYISCFVVNEREDSPKTCIHSSVACIEFNRFSNKYLLREAISKTVYYGHISINNWIPYLSYPKSMHIINLTAHMQHMILISFCWEHHWHPVFWRRRCILRVVFSKADIVNLEILLHQLKQSC